MFVFKTYTLEFEFEFEHMVSYQRMQGGLPMFVVSEFGTFKIFCKNDGLVRPESSYFSSYKHQK